MTHTQATDKMTRTARRSIDTHVRNALSRPRTVFTLRRITQMLYSLGEICKFPEEFHAAAEYIY
jgi:hypothetical protein